VNDKIVKIWLKYANDDLKAGVLLFNNDPYEFKSIVCYHMEQAVEKYLKAYLIFNDKEINKTHDITELIENCKEIDIDFDNIYSFNANELTDYAVNLKYPSSFF
jgi:HEPN domain-containing protein